MTIPLSSARVEQLRRAAKRLANAESIPLHEAQHRLASENGYQNWSLMHKHSQAVRPPKVAVTAVPIVVGNGDRQYLHGDQHELEPAHFYCKACDAFVGAGHFYEKHDRQETLKRTLDALERWARPSNEIAHRRPSNPFNMLEVSARQAAEAYQQSRSPFHRWLEQHHNKRSALGDLASDILGDQRFPVAARTLDEVESYLRMRFAASVAMKALRSAWRRFEADRACDLLGQRGKAPLGVDMPL